MLKVEGNNIYLTRGDTGVIKLDVKDAQGSAYDFSGDEVKFSVKKNLSDRSPVIEKTFDSNGQITFAVEDTANLEFGNYFYDVQLTHTDGTDVSVDTVIVPSTFTVGAGVGWN